MSELVSLFSLNEFCDGYARAIVFTENDESDDSGGSPLSDTYGMEDFSEESFQAINEDCAAFVNANHHLLLEAVNRSGYTSERAGYDFWLNRQGHGVGYWDRDELEADGLGDRLSDACHAYGEHHSGVYLEDDKIHYGASSAPATPDPIVSEPVSPDSIAPTARRRRP